MPMLNLRHQMKSGRKERRTGATASDADRFVLPKIGQQAPVHRDSSRARPPSAYVRLPAIQPETPVYLPKPPAGGKPRRTRGTSGRLSAIPETAPRPSRLPVLVRNDTTRFNNPPKYEPAAAKVTNTSTRRSSVSGYGVASGDMDNMISENEHTRSSTRDRHKRSRRRGSGHTSVNDDASAHASYGAESGKDWNIDQVDPARRATIEHYAKVFDVLVLATSWKLEYDKIEDKKRKKHVNADIEAYQNSD